MAGVKRYLGQAADLLTVDDFGRHDQIDVTRLDGVVEDLTDATIFDHVAQRLIAGTIRDFVGLEIQKERQRLAAGCTG